MIQRTLMLAVMVALGCGVAIGIQSVLNSWSGKIAGPLSTGLLVNMAGGLVAMVIFFPLAFRQSGMQWNDLRSALPYIIISGILGIGIITGIAYAFPRSGIASGSSAIIFGQMFIALLVDHQGWGGSERIPISIGRIAGLVLLMVGVWLLLPRR
jgi:transporter family-2 protein